MVCSKSLRGHLAQENSARSHLEATWLKKARLEVTSRSPGSSKLVSKTLRGHLARKRLEVTRLQPTWLEETVRGNYSKKLFKGAVTAPLSSASLPSASSKTRMDILGFTLVYIYIYIYIYCIYIFFFVLEFSLAECLEIQHKS